jgi:hypothetical protein
MKSLLGHQHFSGTDPFRRLENALKELVDAIVADQHVATPVEKLAGD